MAAELRRAGWGDAEAHHEAARRFGDIEYTRTYMRDEDLRREREKRRMTFFEELKQDLHYAARSLRASPGFAASALLTLALGIGANTAIFSVVRGVLLDPLPMPEADRVVRVWATNRTNGTEQAPVAEPDLWDWQRATKLASSIGGYFFMEGLSGLDLTGQGNPERLSTGLVTDGFFQTLGTPAMLGRTLATEDQVDGRNRVVVLSHGFWTRRFAADPAIVGRAIQLNNEPFTVVGVMPPGFTYPADRTIDSWIPLSFFGPDAIGRGRGVRFLSVIARMKPGVTQAQLHSELASLSRQLAEQYQENVGWDDVRMVSLRESIFGDVRRPLVVLMFAVAMLLLIACVNIASLLLARATVRQRELAVRASLGAGRGRITRQLLTESLVLALLGGVLGVGLALVSVRALASAGASQLPRSGDIRIDAAVLAFTLVVALIAGILFGLYPTLRASSANLLAALRSGARGSVGGAGQKARSALVVVEVALAMILVVGAGLAMKSFSRLLSVKPGFTPDHALVAMMSIGDRYLEDTTRVAWGNYYYGVLDAIGRIPGVTAVGSIRDLPLLANGENVSFNIVGKPEAAPGQKPRSQYHHISTGYFKAMDIPLRSGRTFELTDRSGMPPVVIVNEEFARRYFPGENAVGKAIVFGTRPIEIIGVVGDVRQRGLAEPVDPAIYIHVLQNSRARMSIVVRTEGNPLSYANAIRQAIWSLDRDQTITNVMTLESVLGNSVARPRLLAWLLALFGGLGLTLGALGIFGVLAYAVNQRRQEIGVRVALGATPTSVLSLVVGRGMALAGAGIAIGLAGALLLTRSMQTVLYEVQPTDVATFVTVIVVLLGASLLASWLPARRALAIDPVTALRYD